MRQLIATNLAIPTTLIANGVVPVGNITHKSGCNLGATSTSITAKGQGYYLIVASISVEPTALADITFTMNENGTAIASVSETPAVAGDVLNLTLVGLVYNDCGCSTDSITIVPSAACTVTNMSIFAERV